MHKKKIIEGIDEMIKLWNSRHREGTMMAARLLNGTPTQKFKGSFVKGGADSFKGAADELQLLRDQIADDTQTIIMPLSGGPSKN